MLTLGAFGLIGNHLSSLQQDKANNVLVWNDIVTDDDLPTMQLCLENAVQQMHLMRRGCLVKRAPSAAPLSTWTTRWLPDRAVRVIVKLACCRVTDDQPVARCPRILRHL